MRFTKRSLLKLYIFGILTVGIYFIYWFISTKNEFNKAGADIPTGWLLIIPIANLYWAYKYCEGFSTKIKKGNDTLLLFIVYLLFGLIIPAIVQSELNKYENKKQKPKRV